MGADYSMKKAKYKRLSYKDLLGDWNTLVNDAGTALTESNFNQMLKTLWATEYPAKNFLPELEKEERKERAERLGFWLKNKRT